MNLPRTLSLAFAALAAAILLAAQPAAAQGFIASQIENLISTDTVQVEIEGLSGALSGAVRIEEVRVSDPDGVFLTASDLALDWSPLALARGNIEVEVLSAARIDLQRLPDSAPADPDAPAPGGFSLPAITADIGEIRIAEFILGEAVAGVPARLAATASLVLASEPTRLDASAQIQRLDQPGEIALTLGFAPDENRLALDVTASEPAGGIVAGLLELPGAPPVSLTVAGTGPLSDFAANGSLDIGAERAVTLSAQVTGTAAGRQVRATVDALTAPFVPEQYIDIVGTEANLVVDVLLREDGVVAVNDGRLVSGALQLAASGTLDRNGPGNDLTVAVRTDEGNPVPLAFGEGDARTAIEVTSLDASLSGAFSAAAVEATAAARTAGYGDYLAEGITARLASSGFNIDALTGPFTAAVDAAAVGTPSATATDGIAGRFLDGAVAIAADGALTAEGIVLDSSSVTTGAANAAIAGSAALNFSTFDLALTSDFATAALAEAAVPYVGERTAVSGAFALGADRTLTASGLTVQGEVLSITGSASLAGETVAADIRGTIDQAALPDTNLTGEAAFTLLASGPLAAPLIDLTASADGILVAGRELAGLDARIQGTFSPQAPTGTIAVNGTLDGTPLAVTADFETLAGGERVLNNLLVRQDENTISGEVSIGANDVPTGTLTLAVPDLATLAALAGQDASGDLAGTVVLSVDPDATPVAEVDLTAGSLAYATNQLDDVAIDLRVADYLDEPVANGTVTAAGIEAGAIAVADLALDLADRDGATAIDASAAINTVETAFAGAVEVTPVGADIRLDSLTAAIADAAIRLEAPAAVTIAGGTTRLGALRLAVGEGSLTASGTAGETLDLRLALDAFPFAVANPFAEGLDAAGTLTGTASADGPAGNPNAAFALDIAGLETSQTRAARVPAIAGRIAGRFDDGTTTLDAARIDLGTGRIEATGTVGDDLDLQLVLADLPASLANGFVDGLDASGTISGEADATGSLANPSVVFALDGSGITAPGIERSGIAPLTLDLAGDYRGGTARFETARITVGDGTVVATGSVGRDLDLRLEVDAVPVGLANGFVDGLDVTGTLSGEATATGSLTSPAADFTLAGSGITAPALRRSGIDAVEIDLAGAFAEGTLAIRTAEVEVGDGSLTASGTVGEALDLQVVLDALPVGIANAFVEDLDATGTLSGNATATGSLAEPAADFALSSARITAAPLARSGIDAVALDIAGAYADATLSLRTAAVRIGDGSLTASGTVGAAALDLQVVLDALPVGVANAFVDGLDATGTLSGNAAATGSLADPAATFALTSSGLGAAPLRRSGIDTVALDVAGAYADETATIERANIQVGDGRITASGTVGRTLDVDVALEALPVGIVNAYVPDLEASGTISGNATATGSIADPDARFSLTSDGLSAAPLRQSGIDTVVLDVAGAYADETATIERADIEIGEGRITASGTVGRTLDVDVTVDALPVGVVNAYLPDIDASGTISGTASATGSIADPDAQFTVTSDGLTAAPIREAGIATVALDVAGAYAGGTATIEQAEVQLGDGRITASGTIGEALDVAVTLDAVPVAIANGFVPGLGAEGSLSGTASATGSLADPDARFDLRVAGVSVAQTRGAGLPPIEAAAAGAFADGTATIEAARIDLAGGQITATGTVGEALDVDVTLAGIPASILAGVAPGVAPTGTIAGSVSATGSLADPAVTYDLSVSSLTLQQTRDAGVGPLDISADGTFADQVVALDAALSGSGLAFAASGTVDIAGGPSFDLALDGTAPLSLANPILAGGGRSVDGTVSVDVAVSGTAAAPDISGTVSVAGASFVDTGANVAINAIAATISLGGQSATITGFSGELSSGGTLAVGGTVGLTGGFPADLTIQLVEGRYADGELLSISLDADLTLTGDLTGSPVLAGTIDADEINILVPDTLPTSLARLDVRRVNAPPAVLEQLREIDPDTGGSGNDSAGISLDITLNAPNRVFVRGRGLDIELGGSVAVAGPVSALAITGGFELQRGRFEILSRRLDFERATLTFNGDLLPTLDLLAVSDTGEVTVSVAITGPATDPSFSFSSSPALPQDEVLARLIFGQATADLSPLQIAQLAAAAAQLAGVGGSTGLLDNLRAQLGVDDLDIRTNADGQTAVGVGRYLNDNTYVGVDSTGRVSIDLEITDNIKARGAVTANGGGEVGIFYEREY